MFFQISDHLSSRPPISSIRHHNEDRSFVEKRKWIPKTNEREYKSYKDYGKDNSKYSKNYGISSNIKSSRFEDKNKYKQSGLKYLNENKLTCCFLLLILLLITSLIYKNAHIRNSNEEQYFSLESLQVQYHKQDSQFWRAIVTGIDLTIEEEQPSSYIFLFESDAQETTKKLLQDLSKYAVCRLTTCDSHAINFQDEILESPKFHNAPDFGSVLANLKENLTDNGLMIVENLDEVPEKFALAFHFFCDEFSPLVKKSAFFFTMKVNKFGKSPLDDLRYVEQVLRRSWNGMNEDTFLPLFTRISSMLLKVYPNHKNE